MCLRNRVSAPDTSTQRAEAERQRMLEEQRFNQRSGAEQRRWDQQRADEERRYQAQLEAQLAEAARQRQERMAEQARQDGQLRDQETRRESERMALQTQAEERARSSREYVTGRQGLMQRAETDINEAYSGFDDGFFQNFARAFVDQGNPEIERQAAVRGRGTKFAAARKGRLASSATANEFGDLNREKQTAQAQLARQGQGAANSFRDSIDSQRREALTSIWQAGGVGAPNLPDGVSDVNTALGGLGQQLASITQTTRNQAARVQRPF